MIWCFDSRMVDNPKRLSFQLTSYKVKICLHMVAFVFVNVKAKKNKNPQKTIPRLMPEGNDFLNNKINLVE